VSCYSISELEQLSGIKAHTIRMWEQRYGVLRPVRSATNIRKYCDDDLRRLLNVATLCGRGQRISQVASLSDEELTATVRAGCQSADCDYTEQVNTLLTALLAFDEPRLHQLLNKASRRLGFEGMMLHVVYPLLQRIGTLWLTRAISTAHEHLLSHLLRQKVLAATEALPAVAASADTRRWLLFLPAHELHELALLLMNYVLRARGQHTLYLGQNMPITELGEVCETYRPDVLVAVLTSQPERARVATFAQELQALCPDKQLVLYGPLTRQEGLVLPATCAAPPTMVDFIELVEKSLVAVAQ
jgi:DNA-binding transcriptional MerR regulator